MRLQITPSQGTTRDRRDIIIIIIIIVNLRETECKAVDLIGLSQMYAYCQTFVN